MSRRKSYRLPNLKNRSLAFVLGVAVGTGVRELYYAWLESKDVDDSKLATAWTASPGLEHFAKDYGLPQPSTVQLIYSNHVVGYDQAKRIPAWVLERIVSDQLKTGQAADRQKSHFKVDHNVDPKFRSSNDDYFGSGYSRGHMVPAGTLKHSQQAMDETFYLSNIVPQEQENNAGFWYRMELYCRHLAKKYDTVYVVSGPVFLPEEDPDSKKKFIKYEVIGSSNVAVPTHLFKVIATEKDGSAQCVGAFVVPNKPIPRGHTLRDYQVSLDELERYSGMKFLPKLSGWTAKDLCVTEGCHMISTEKLDFINVSRMLRNAKNMDDLNSMWSVVTNKKVAVDEGFMGEYETKKKRFLSQESSS